MILQPGESSQTMQKKRVLVVCQHYWPETFRINDIVDYFIEKSLEVDVLCGLPNYPEGKFYKGYGYFGKRHEIYKGARIERVLEIKRGNNTNIRIFLNYISFSFFSLFHIPKMLTRKYDKIFIYQLSPVMMSIAGILIGKIKKIETTMYVLDMWPENLFSVIKVRSKTLRQLLTDLSHWHYKNVDKLIVLSDTMKNNLLNVTNKKGGDFLVLPQTSEKIFEKKICDNKIKNKFNNSFNILFTGNISPAQSFETIIEAALIIKSKGFENINWIIVGDGMSRKWLENELLIRGLDDCFYIEGYKPIEEIPKYTYIADLLIGCLVKSELLEATIPAKVMSYIAAGKPIVLAMDGEVQDLINYKIKCGFAGPAGDATKMAQNIEKIYKLKPTQRVILGNKAYTFYLKHFERNHLLKKLYDFTFR